MTRLLPAPIFAVVLTVFALTATSASSADYGDFDDFAAYGGAFLDVRDEQGRFGTPQQSLLSLDFPSADFEIACSQCPTGERISDVLTLDYRVDRPGRFPYGLSIGMGYDYILQSFGRLGEASFSITARAAVEVLEIDGLAVESVFEEVPFYFHAYGLEDPAVGSLERGLNGIAVDAGIVDARAILDLSGLIHLSGRSGRPTLVRVVLENELEVRHMGAGQSALQIRTPSISDISGIGGLSGRPHFETRAPIPEPSTATLLGLGLSLLARGRRPCYRNPHWSDASRASDAGFENLCDQRGANVDRRDTIACDPAHCSPAGD